MTQSTTIRIPTEVVDPMRKIAQKNRRTLTAEVAIALERHVAENANLLRRRRAAA
jgi:predicted transcriptional regulator